jgi:hypothetical protein
LLSVWVAAWGNRLVVRYLVSRDVHESNFSFFMEGTRIGRVKSKVMEKKPILEWFLLHEEHVIKTQSLQGIV